MKLLTQLALACFALGCFASQATAKRTCKISLYAGMKGHRKTASFNTKVGGFLRRPKKQCIAIIKKRNFIMNYKHFVTTKVLPKSNQFCTDNPYVSFAATAYLYRRRKPFEVGRSHPKTRRYRAIFNCRAYKDCKLGPCTRWRQDPMSGDRFYCTTYRYKNKDLRHCPKKFLKKDYRWVNHGAR